ncbi:SPOR domain-containing protein [Sphingomonas sp. RP10(2022)]|uniref:SPOR domain-containing protein n=1 Tax=Sphingomonas liriopis TaxID=2949094 RepID=A0A9X2KQC5_9SPHN|nr:SPOR domain-containing protein [Sphingomonas liriopis]MCP3734845.1 SPOR domain-containing protein [Sphingomonas liriopis]
MRILIPALLASAALLLTCAPVASSAQEVVQALPGTTDADRLAEQMRALAANPRDLNALIAAADLSLALGDLSGAASLYARAEKVSVSDPRIKAGEGAILVRSERPGEALRYFAQAEAAGYPVSRFAADRGLAYDLIGQSERAQRDYRLALKTRADDEIVKRYALSLGIVGKREAALEQLDPLLRKADRSAWRVRAFVLAMSGDQAGAERIVTTMLPQGMAQGLLPFFRRLPALPAADRAFAVHFGEVHATPERIADARLAPNLPQLAPEPQPVTLASVQAVQQPKGRDRDRRRRDRAGREPIALAANTRQPAASSSPAAPSYPAATAALARVQPLPQPTRSAPVTLASAAPVVTRPAVPVTTIAPVAGITTAPVTTTASITGNTTALITGNTVAPVTTASITGNPAATSSPGVGRPVAVAPATTTPVVASNVAEPLATVTRPATVATVPAAVAPVATTSPAPTTAAPVRSATPSPGFATSPVQPVVAATPTPAAPAPAAVTATTPPDFSAPPSRAEADSVLARIVAGLSIPAAELGVVVPAKPVPVTAPPPESAARVVAEAKAKEERDAAAEKALAAKAAADKRTADRKAAADKKALAAKKLADEKKLAEAKAAAEEKKAARANPERIWVQVAGGAYAGDLPKAYAAVRAKAPAVFGSRGGWSTPLRATNRVLTGPFKTDTEARAFVNQLARAGVSAFTFTSDAGQAVTRLPAK